MNSKAIKRQLLAAIAMVLVAAIALGSSTYAWFVASNTVTADGMKLQVQGESGIVIKSVENSASVWAATASAGMNKGVALTATSTTNLSTWVHATSDVQDNAKAEQAFKDYTAVSEANLDSYRLLKSFYIRSATANEVENVKLAIDSVTVTTTNDTASSQNLNRSVRVGVKVGNNFVIYAPLADDKSPANDTRFVLNAKYVTEGKPVSVDEYVKADPSRDVFTLTDNKVPATDTGLTAEIYMWFEGEDGNCMSKNITATLDELNVTVVFKTVPFSTDAP